MTKDSNSHSKLTIKLKIEARILAIITNCSIQNEEENTDNKADKGKHEIKQSEQKQEKNVSKLYTGNLNLDIKENDLVELFGRNTTKYL